LDKERGEEIKKRDEASLGLSSYWRLYAYSELVK